MNLSAAPSSLTDLGRPPDREALELDPALIARYAVNGPRYTSYPTAAQFSADFGELDYRRAAGASNAEDAERALSLYVHLPFCREACWYCGCHRSITHRPERARAYLQALESEIALQAPLFDVDRQIHQLHFGGGTPTFYGNDDLAALLAVLQQHFPFASRERREFGIEIDPRSIAPDQAADLVALGFNRMSLGIQDFDPEVQEAVNRVQSPESVSALVDAIRDAGVESVSFDLILGLPGQTPERFSRTLETVTRLAPDRLSLYSYAHLPERFPLQRLMPEDRLPDLDTRLLLLRDSHAALRDAGYVHVGMDHFALPGDPLVRALRDGSMQRNFQGYSTHRGYDLVGLGASAISSFGDSYAQNETDIRRWQETVQAGRLPVARGVNLTADDRLRRDIIQALMCDGVVDIARIECMHGIAFYRHFDAALRQLLRMQDDGLLRLDRDSIRLTGSGRLLMRNVAMCFDAYLPKTPQRYSRVI